MELLQEIESKTRQLEMSIKTLRKSGTDYAEAEKKLQDITSAGMHETAR